ncbi:MAG: GGDEF domain-containing protein [Oceanospirillales bacterium]|uniref:diguanylate cyclase n=1 Tax=Marinobacterium halophilum TaxID=267374 RepID=A0A2P8EXE5_9GAMM|nr:GGDEF domain-containing protein [Marinobacterium halophilum]MBR9829347.1 GGDEF domain-containing protein [Oceanospirillales bacterium]PSL14139.1 diguanylate cyclase (GGDEF)-like protein [Marinobacterium halophilum]
MWEVMTDLLVAGRHSRYFNHTRSHHLFTRVRLLAWLLMVLQSGWILIDWLLLPAAVSSSIAYARLATSGCCLLLALWCSHAYRLEVSLIRLLLLVLVLTLFQTASTWVLEQQGYHSHVAGYAFFPFMIITMLAIFPLTVLEVAGFTVFVILVEWVTQLWLGTFGQVESLNDLWLLGILGCIAGWASVNQLSMLLVLYRQATRDPLTGLANRRQVMDQLDEDIEAAEDSGQMLVVMMFDLDKFKSFNDHYGHAAGDIVLKQFARILRDHARRNEDLAGRFGGEEFLMLMPNMDARKAGEVADSIRQACHQSRLRVPTGEEVSFSTSIGIAELMPGEDRSSVLQRVDEALYKAKDSGRDRACVADSVRPRSAA